MGVCYVGEFFVVFIECVGGSVEGEIIIGFVFMGLKFVYVY